jgi:release factor glutamine methyltransferase
LAPENSREALLAGPDGLDAIRAVIPRVPSGALALEVGDGQAGAVAELLRGAGFASVDARADLAGIERVVVGER